MGQNNNHKSNFHFLIFVCKSFAVNYSLKSGTHRHHQTLGFIPGDALPGLYCNRLQFLLVLGAFSSLQFCLQQVKCMLNRIQVRWWLGHCITVHFFPSKTLWLLLQYGFGSLSICTVEAPSNEVLKHLAEYEQIILPEHFRIHPAAFVSSHIINKYKRTSFHWQPYMPTLPPPCFTDRGGMLRITSSSFPSPYSSLPITLVTVDLGLICSIGCCSRTVKARNCSWS